MNIKTTFMTKKFHKKVEPHKPDGTTMEPSQNLNNPHGTIVEYHK